VRYLIVADIHGNAEALNEVLARAADEGFDDLLVLGDLVGYGGGPNDVVEVVRRRAKKENVIRGNHDKVVAAIEDGENFNDVALAAALWTREALSRENLEYVRELAQGPVETASGAVICHGSPLDEDEYVLSLDQAGEIFLEHQAPLTFFGHTHLPMMIGRNGAKLELLVLKGEKQDLELSAARQYLFNPGSVGQPRDRDPRSAFAIYDNETGVVHWRRVEYPVEEAQKRIQDAGLPPVLAYRLSVGV
jgi:diadenosine tetraphosphatase ApaH/serine/threonine PP2A family protein phosphatase